MFGRSVSRTRPRSLRVENLENRSLCAADLASAAFGAPMWSAPAQSQPAAVYGPQVAAAAASSSNNTMATAENIGSVLGRTVSRNGSVGGRSDPVDFYKFTPDSRSFNLTGKMSVKIQLTNLSADLDLYVLDSRGRVIASSTKGGSNSEVLNLSLSQGTQYFVKVVPYGNAVSNYKLSITT